MCVRKANHLDRTDLVLQDCTDGREYVEWNPHRMERDSNEYKHETIFDTTVCNDNLVQR